MGTISQRQRYCPTCQQPRLFAKAGVNHILHLLLTVVTCSAWLLVWLTCLVVNAFRHYRCQTCGRAAPH